MLLSSKHIDIGQEIPPVKKEITLDRLRLYSHWVNRNIHTDLEWAKKAGLPAVIAAGLMSHAYLSEMLTNAFGESWFKGGKLSCSFIHYISPGDNIVARGFVREKVKEGSGVKCTIEVWCENGIGDRVTAGTASIFLPK